MTTETNNQQTSEDLDRTDPTLHRFITDSKGNRFYPGIATEFDIEDIAHALSMTVRFGGKIREFYSVAQHSVLVSHLMEEVYPSNPLEGLLHDASEAYLADLPTPVKRLLPGYMDFEDDLLQRMREFWKLPVKKSLECDAADKLAMFLEAFVLMPYGELEIDDPLRLREYAEQVLYENEVIRRIVIRPWSWPIAKQAFLNRYRELM